MALEYTCVEPDEPELTVWCVPGNMYEATNVSCLLDDDGCDSGTIVVLYDGVHFDVVPDVDVGSVSGCNEADWS